MNFMISIFIFVIDFLRIYIVLGQSDLPKYGRPNIWIKYSNTSFMQCYCHVRECSLYCQARKQLSLCIEILRYPLSWQSLLWQFCCIRNQTQWPSYYSNAVISESCTKKPLLHPLATLLWPTLQKKKKCFLIVILLGI